MNRTQSIAAKHGQSPLSPRPVIAALLALAIAGCSKDSSTPGESNDSVAEDPTPVTEPTKSGAEAGGLEGVDKIAMKKSEEAGAAVAAFQKAKTAKERAAVLIGDSKTVSKKVANYDAKSPNGGFRLLKAQILFGFGRQLDDPNKFVFPYIFLTDKNTNGFIVLVYETNDGFKMNWDQFVEGQDNSLEEFVAIQQTEQTDFLVALERAHSFDDRLSEAERSKLIAAKVTLPPYKETLVVYVEPDSAPGKALAEALPWGKNHICRIGIAFVGKKGKRVPMIKEYTKVARKS